MAGQQKPHKDGRHLIGAGELQFARFITFRRSRALRRERAKRLHRSLLLDLIPSLHSDSPFPGRKFPEDYHAFTSRVAAFYELTGILPGKVHNAHGVMCHSARLCVACPIQTISGLPSRSRSATTQPAAETLP
jgi:hypothetical protein